MMRLVFLNLWRGKLSNELKTWLAVWANQAEIFCFQEVPRNDYEHTGKIVFDDLQNLLPRFCGYFRDYVAPGEYGKEGLAIFVKKGLPVYDQGEIFVYNPPTVTLNNTREQTLWRNLAYVQLENGGQKFLIANWHGLFDGPDKRDNPDRLEQARRVKTFLNQFPGAKILGGDFNLLPNSGSLKILSAGMRDLIKEYRITSTRSPLFVYANKFADYLLVSPEIKVKQFKVLDDLVSDHLPLFLEFE